MNLTKSQLEYLVGRLCERTVHCDVRRDEAIYAGDSHGADYWRRERKIASDLIDEILITWGTLK